MADHEFHRESRRFVSDDAANPQAAKYWVGRGERLGAALQAVPGLWAAFLAFLGRTATSGARGDRALRS
jgi:hypothetical protein